MKIRTENQGFTLVEVLLAAGVFAVVTMIALSFSVAATKQAEINTNMAYALRGQVTAMELMRQELGQSSAVYTGEDLAGGTPAPPHDAIVILPNEIQFRRMAGYNPASYQTVWSNLIVYKLLLAPGENIGDDADNDGDGIIDEPGEENAPVLNNADDNGNGFIDEYCLVRRECIGPADPAGGPSEESYITTDILFRNLNAFQVIQDGNMITLRFIYMTTPGDDPTNPNLIYTDEQIQMRVALNVLPTP